MWSRRRVLGAGGGLVASLPLLPCTAQSHGNMPSWPRSPALRKFVDALPQLPPLQSFRVEDFLSARKADCPGEGPDPIPVAPYLRGRREPPLPQERGWKDTVVVEPKKVVRIIARFDGFPGQYPWHCHMLEHEDNEMMLPFEVVPRPA
ncbi:MAG: multicopper oxidase domain-containing protein [Hyphomicrobiales bacterium]|nr:multicopper oxidase domain-containing protein [Hyphomicrobiales bacterium]